MAHLSRPVTRRELLESGVPARTIDAMRHQGELQPIFRGVYLPRGVADSLESRAAAAALVMGDDQIVCDRAAAYLHGVDAYGLKEAHSRPLETCVMRGGTRSRRRDLDGRVRDLESADVERRGPVRVTTPRRTALDLGCALPRHRALGVMDELLRAYDIRGSDLSAEVPRFRGRRGVVQLRDLAGLVDPRAESQRESWLRLEISDAGLPPPKVQWRILIRGIERWRLDLAYPDYRIAIEYDGEEFHLLTEDQAKRDAARRRWLRDHGWTVIVVTKASLLGPDSDWLELLKEALRPQTRRFRWEQRHDN